MLVISAGMPKSCSAYIYNIINELLKSAGFTDARKVKEKYSLENQLRWANNNIGDLNKKLLLKLMLIAFKEKGYVVKTHSPPTRFLSYMLKIGLIKTIYISRDPRDVLLSAIDHGKKIIENGETHIFAQMVDFDLALINVKKWINIRNRYDANPNVLCISYEDLILSPKETLDQIVDYLNVKIDPEKIDEILFKYDKNNNNADMRGLHFNKAKLNRYKKEFSEIELERFNDELGEQLIKMGYSM